MPTMVTDTQDRFAEVFGNKRGAGRPDEEITPADEVSPTGLRPSVVCAGGCGNHVEVSPLNLISPFMPSLNHYCAGCLPNARREEQREVKALFRPGNAVDTKAKQTIIKLQRDKKDGRRREYRAEQKRWRKCLLSRPFGHAWTRPEKSPMVMVRGVAYVCGGCGKIKCKDR